MIGVRRGIGVHRFLSTALLLTWQVAFAGAPVARENYSPYADEQFPRNLYWGDTHLHTAFSSDAYGFGNGLTPEDAYRFARGETIISNSGQPARLSRPLDFLVVADHAEYLGISAMLEESSDLLANSAVGQRWLAHLREGKRAQILMDGHQVTMGNLALPRDVQLTGTLWRQVVTTADHYNEPSQFTAFIGFEWTALPDGNNLHRNVIFRDGADRAQQVLPFSAIDSRDPEDLWRYLAAYERRTGGQVLAIPHNANVSNGLMFSDRTLSGEPLDESYARQRARWEPLVEVTQIKGDGETHPYLSPDDDFADFETWDSGNFALPPVPKEHWMLRHEYARAALLNGLVLERAIGVNPFAFGMIGSTDSHVALAAVEENNFFGKFGRDEPSAGRANAEQMPAARYAASGYAAVWAAENTREALFDAMRRREVYATTGPRIVVRFFGGWTFEREDAQRPDIAATGYRGGVPMGAMLNPAPAGVAPAGTAPTFLVAAARDPLGANLDRVQVVKGWLDAAGVAVEKVYDVALSGDRSVDPATGKAPPVGTSVDTATASYSNSIGAPQLTAVWRDPDFDPRQAAFYYLRVLEIPTPRWTTYDSAYYGSPLPAGYPAEIQERAYSSPIWYRPR